MQVCMQICTQTCMVHGFLCHIFVWKDNYFEIILALSGNVLIIFCHVPLQCCTHTSCWDHCGTSTFHIAICFLGSSARQLHAGNGQKVNVHHVRPAKMPNSTLNFIYFQKDPPQQSKEKLYGRQQKQSCHI